MEFMLLFQPLHQGRSFAFPCTQEGVVEVKGLAEAAQRNYDLACDLVGREFLSPVVVPWGDGHALR